jgi:glycosyltransferase involved in cell wall biosynthesis
MKIIFPTAHFYPSRAAHARHSLEMARAFTKELGKDFLFIIGNTDEKDLLQGINYIETKYSLFLKKIRARTIFYFFWLFKFFLFQKNRKSITLFINDRKLNQICIILRLFFGFKIIFECHGLYNTFSDEFLVKYSDGTVFTTQGIVYLMSKRMDLSNKKHIVLPNAVDINLFNSISGPKPLLREKLDLPKDKFLVGYVGRFKPLGYDKGIIGMMDALKLLPDNVSMCFVGGVEREIDEYKQIAQEKGIKDRCIFVGYISPEKIASYMKAVNVLALTPPATEEFFVYHTSPMKMFEYMASKTPIIASNLPSLKEILDEKIALFIKPADVQELAKAISKLSQDSDLATYLAENAFKKVQEFTWEKRAKKVISFTADLKYL